MVAIALITTLALASGGWWLARRALAQRRTRPVFDPRQEGLRHNPCASARDCPRGQICIEGADGQRWCRGNECQADADCSDGFVCREVVDLSASVSLLCILAGTRGDDEECELHPRDREHACRKGLVCDAGRCSRPCQLTNPASCPAGFTCTFVGAISTCKPSCRATGCTAGKTCVPMGWRTASRCVSLNGEDCIRSPLWRRENVRLRFHEGG
jgi:hypothetical protein